jgi:hypothetical protein
MTAATATRLDPGFRADKVRKIRALLCKTVARGCTPEEAEAAALLAERLMAKYDIDRDECVEHPLCRHGLEAERCWLCALTRMHAEEATQPKSPRRSHRSHAHCSHEATSSARAKCRKAGGPA